MDYEYTTIKSSSIDGRSKEVRAMESKGWIRDGIGDIRKFRMRRSKIVDVEETVLIDNTTFEQRMKRKIFFN